MTTQRNSNTSSNKNESLIELKPVKPRYIIINEDIHASLDGPTLLLYMAFRFIADYSSKDATVRCSSEFLYKKAGISRAQFFRCLNKLENFGLVLRDANSVIGEKSIYHVAQDLNYFKTSCIPVSERDYPVSERDTYHYSFQSNNINIITSDDDSEKTENPSQPEQVPKVTDQQIVDVYHEELPECPKIKVIDRLFSRQLKAMIKKWTKYQKEGKSFTIDSFRDFLRYIKKHYHWLTVPYMTNNGNLKKNSLRDLTKDTLISKIVNGEFNAS